MRVSYAPNGHNYRLVTQNGFGGINNNIGAEEGEIFSAMNMSADAYPVLSTRKEGLKGVALPANAKKLYAFKMIDGIPAYVLYEELEDISQLYWVYLYYGAHRVGKLYADPVTEATINAANIIRMGDLLCLYCNDAAKGKNSYIYDLRAEEAADYTDYDIGWIKDSPQEFAEIYVEGQIILTKYVYLNGQVTVTEEKHYIYTSGAWQEFTPFREMEWKASATGQFTDGTLSGIAAEANTLKIFIPSRWTYNDRLSVGDAVSVEAGTNSKTAIVREIAEDESYIYLRFSDHTWENTSEMATVKINRNVPKMFNVFEHENRLWGYSEKDIFCSRLGEPASWYTYEGTADSAWAAQIGSGKLTGGCSYRHPMFFTEDRIYTILGDEPDNFTFSVTPSTYGCADGSWDSFAVVGAYLYYHSPWGFIRYSGGIPQLISKALGIDIFANAHAGGAGNKYYVTCVDMKDNARSFVLDTMRGLWHEQTAIKDTSYAADGNCVYSATWHGVWKYVLENNEQNPTTEFAGKMPSSVVFSPMRFSSIKKKQIKTIYIRHDIEDELRVKLFEDGVENTSFEAILTGKGVTEITGRPERSDEFQLKLFGTGQWKVFSIAFEYWEGSAKP